MLTAGGRLPGLDGAMVGDFWRWAYSDALSNRNRSIFAEFLVGAALGAVGRPRQEWTATDLEWEGLKIEVKSSAACQSWAQKRPFRISFSVRKAMGWDAETGESAEAATRSADVYVFCHFTETDSAEAHRSVLDARKWDFHVVSMVKIDAELGEAKSVSLKGVQRVAERCGVGELRTTVRRVGRA